MYIYSILFGMLTVFNMRIFHMNFNWFFDPSADLMSRPVLIENQR